mgnify:CR=1 FL=1
MIFELAWRNLWRNRRRTLLSVSAVTFTVIILILLPSMQVGGYAAMIRASTQVLDGYAQLQQVDYLDKPSIRHSFAVTEQTLSGLRQQFPDLALSPRMSGFALASSEGRTLGVQVLGVDAGYEPKVSSLPGTIRQGRYLQNSDELVMGATLASNLQLKLGDPITLLGSGRDGSLAVDSLKLVGIFESGSKTIDRQLVEMDIQRFNQTFAMQGQYHAIVISAESRSTVMDRVQALSVIGQNLSGQQSWVVRPWSELETGLLKAIKIDMSTAALVYLVLVVVVCFTLLNTLLMSLMERTREFGMMMALGVRPALLGKVIWLENCLTGLLGVAAGMLLGSLLVLWLESHGITFDSAEAVMAEYGLSSTLYPDLNALSLLAGPGVVMLVLMLAGLFPLFKIRRLSVLDAMRSA